MENDSIRASGGDTLVDIWIDGKLRAISVSREAIETFLGLHPDKAAAMGEDERCEFVRTHMAKVLAAAKDRLRDTDPAANTVVIGDGHLPGGKGRVERRKADRRKGERRKTPRAERPLVDRRKGERRKGERRKPPKA